MADVEIGVQAEGVEDAVGEVPPGEAGDAGGGGMGGGGRGGGGVGGKLGKLLGIVATILAFGEDIFKVIGVVSSVLRAFLAPVAVLLLRLLGPTLRALLSVLPVWFDIMEVVTDVISKLAPLLSIFSILNYLTNRFMGASLGEVSSMLLDAVKKAFKQAFFGNDEEQAPGTQLGNVRDRNIDLSDQAGRGTTLGTRQNDRADASEQAGRGTQLGNAQGGTTVNISGGLCSFVERIDRDSGVESP